MDRVVRVEEGLKDRAVRVEVSGANRTQSILKHS